jgi:hypothetical protein
VLPNLIVIGAQKCGTSGLHSYLGLHPQISMSRPKELDFFLEERNWSRGTEWYSGHFDPSAGVRGESSPNYTAYPHHVGVAERMAATVPDAKLIFMVRDPIDRIAAHWVHNYAKRREKGNLRETLMDPSATYIARSRYHMQLERFLAHYPLDRVLVLEQEDLRDRRARTIRDVFEFVGVDPEFTHRRFGAERHQTSLKTRESWFGLRRRPIERPDVRAALDDDVIQELRDDAVRLRELTGREFASWSIWSR